MFCGAVERLNHKADAYDDRRNRRQRLGRYAGKGDNRQDDHRDPCSTFGQQTYRLRLIGETSPFDIRILFRPPSPLPGATLRRFKITVLAGWRLRQEMWNVGLAPRASPPDHVVDFEMCPAD